MQECIECHYWFDSVCENPACPNDKHGRQLEMILEAQEAWIRQREMEDMWRKDYLRLYAPTSSRR
jgi:hypothetical protein